MPVTNAEVAGMFNQVADLLELQDANPFRVRAYRNAAQTVALHPRSLAEMVRQQEDLTELPDIGEDIAGKINEIVETGHLQQLADLQAETSPELPDLMAIPGLGSKRVQQLHEALGIETVADLRAAAKAGKVREVPGFGQKSEQNILENVARADQQRTKLVTAEQIVGPLLKYLRAHDATKRVAIAGSYRRRKEIIGDLDIVVVSNDGAAVSEHFVAYEDVVQIIAQGETRSTVVLRSGLQVDIRVVPEESFGAALHYFTGSKAHNLALRRMGQEQGLKVNEYGIWDGNEQIAGATEAEMYGTFDLPVIPPELREDRGEIEAARAGTLPDLVTLEDLRGDLHSHTIASDGKDSLVAMADAAQKRGYAYLAITDHSPNVAVTRGLNADRLAEQIDAIDQLNESFGGFRLLKGVEVDILENGSLDLPDAILKRLDVCVCSIHTDLGLSRDKQTARLLRALDNPHCHIIGHTTERLIGKREPINLDLERVMEAALERGCYFEINADPNRLDLNDIHARMAVEMGLKLAISTDAHRTTTLDHLRFGVDVARRGWLTADDVLNTRSWPVLKELLAR
jgi:DNA polymerase (family 10)